MQQINAPLQRARKMLLAGVGALQLDISEAQADKLLSYLQLLLKWGKTYNLTAILDLEEAVIKHLLDSLSIASYLHQGRCIDVGTGAGLPGIPLAILLPDSSFALVDSNFKKVRFLQQAQLELELTNIEPLHSRIEQVKNEKSIAYSQILSRAFSSLKNIAEMCYPLLEEDGSLLAMKGKVTEKELSELNQLSFKIKNLDIKRIDVPFLNEERHLVVFS